MSNDKMRADSELQDQL